VDPGSRSPHLDDTPEISHKLAQPRKHWSARSQAFLSRKRSSTGQAAATAFEFVWELSLGIYLTVKGFRSSPITTVDVREEVAKPSMAMA
jgi:hypothetical protein